MVDEVQKMNNVKIEDLIYEVRGQYVMLDSDLASIYGYKDGAKAINKAVKRHVELFSNEIYFQLSSEEWDKIRESITDFCGTSSDISGTAKDFFGTANMMRFLPYVFPLEGIKILSSILRKPNVQSVTLDIINTFENLKSKNSHNLSIPVSKGEIIENLIYEIREKQVMLDFDLARIYECKNGTKTINLAVKRHPKMFTNDLYFQLTEEEFLNLKFQIETSSWNEHGGIRKLPYAFTEEGVYMIATIIRTSVAEFITSRIIRAFVSMRRYIGDNLVEQKYVNNQVLINTNNIDKADKRIETLELKFKELQNSFSEFQNNRPLTYFQGQIFDAYLKLIEIMKDAKKELIIIDRYADLDALDMISKASIPVILVIGKKAKIKELDIQKYNSNYNNLTVIINDTFHDRYLILDRKTIYHCGTSLNSAGVRTFSINKWEDEIVVEPFLNSIEKIISCN